MLNDSAFSGNPAGGGNLFDKENFGLGRETQIEQLYPIFDQLPFTVAIISGEEYRIEFVNKSYLNFWQTNSGAVFGKPMAEASKEIHQALVPLISKVYETGKQYSYNELEIAFHPNGKTEKMYFKGVIEPLFDKKNPLRVILTGFDITQQVRAMKQQEESERFMTTLISNLPGMVYRCPPEEPWPLDYASAGVFDLCGYHPEDFTSRRISWADLMHPDDVEEVGRLVEQGLFKQKIFTLSYRIRTSSGEYRWVWDRGQGVYNPEGKLLNIEGFVTDITVQKLAEDALKKSEEYYKDMTDHTPVMTWITRADGYCTYLNKQWYNFTGQEADHALGFGWLDALHPDDLEKSKNTFLEANALLKPYIMEYRLRRQDGEYFWHMDAGLPKFNTENEFEGFVGAVVNIDDRRKIEESLKESELKFRVLADNLPALCWMADAEGWIFWYNSRWYEYTGTTPEQMEGWGWQSVHDPEVLPKVIDRWKHSLATGEPFEMVFPLLGADGIFRPFLTRVIPIRDESGKIANWFGTNTDIEKQKQAEEEQKRFAEKLEAMVQMRTEELQRSNQDLQQFAHVASHDLKEPVRKIKTFVNLLQSEFSGNLPVSGITYLEKVRNAANRIAIMIEGVLAYSSVNAIQRNIEKIDLKEVVDQITSDLEIIIKEKKATIKLKGELPVIEGASVLIHQVFYNLINNSLKFASTDRSPVIEVSSANKSYEGKEFVEIRIRDNGIGFKSEYSDVIFDTFRRLHSKDDYEGTGLGLSLCKKIVERHDGIISASPGENHGAEFKLTLPFEQNKQYI